MSDERGLYREDAIPKVDLLDQAQARVRELETQLVAMDALLEGDAARAQVIAPGMFVVRKRHVAERFTSQQLRELSSGAFRDYTDVRPVRHYVSGALPQLQTEFRYETLELTACGLSQPDQVTRQPLTRSQTSLPRAGDSGLPSGWTWLVLGWTLELRHTEGWDCSGIEGAVTLSYNGRPIALRPLTDALRPVEQDLLSVFREHLGFYVRVELQNGPVPPTGFNNLNARIPRPRLYVFLDVLEKRVDY